jgi:uncharacterized membrane protein
MTFQVRLFRWPLVAIMAAALMAFVLVSLICRKKIKASKAGNPSISN